MRRYHSVKIKPNEVSTRFKERKINHVNNYHTDMYGRRLYDQNYDTVTPFNDNGIALCTNGAKENWSSDFVSIEGEVLLSISIPNGSYLKAYAESGVDLLLYSYNELDDGYSVTRFFIYDVARKLTKEFHSKEEARIGMLKMLKESAEELISEANK